MRFLNSETMWGNLTGFRTLWLSGRYGGGKTSLAIALGARLLKEGYADKIVANFPMIGRTYPVPVPLTNAVIILDEAWQYMKDGQAVEDYAAFLRKFNVYLIMPSVLDIHHSLRYLATWRVFNGEVIGLPMWFYRWKLFSRSMSDQGFWVAHRPHTIFGSYPTKGIVKGGDGGISKAIRATVEMFGLDEEESFEFLDPAAAEAMRRVEQRDMERRNGTKTSSPRLATAARGSGGIASITSTITAAAEDVQDGTARIEVATDTIGRIVKQFRR